MCCLLIMIVNPYECNTTVDVETHFLLTEEEAKSKLEERIEEYIQKHQAFREMFEYQDDDDEKVTDPRIYFDYKFGEEWDYGIAQDPFTYRIFEVKEGLSYFIKQ